MASILIGCLGDFRGGEIADSRIEVVTRIGLKCRSLAIFIIAVAVHFSWPDNLTVVSCELMLSKNDAFALKVKPVRLLRLIVNALPNCGGVLLPVHTVVPLYANRCKRF